MYHYVILALFILLHFSQSVEVTLKTIHPTCTFKQYSCHKTYLLCIVEAVVHGEVSATGWIWPKLDTQHTDCCSAAGNHVLVCLVGAVVDGAVIFLTDPAQVCHGFPNDNVGAQQPPQLSTNV